MQGEQVFSHGSIQDAGPKVNVPSDLPDLSRSQAQCLCVGCPPWPKGSMVYCILGKGDADPVGQGCRCGGCRVKSELGMASDRFCETGSEKEQQNNDVLVIY